LAQALGRFLGVDQSSSGAGTLNPETLNSETLNPKKQTTSGGVPSGDRAARGGGDESCRRVREARRAAAELIGNVVTATRSCR
jgi:hypothetical protein